MTINTKKCSKCAICEVHENDLKKPLAVDHNHITGNIRGLLCINCNTGIGKFKDSTELLNKTIKYLKSEETNAK
jgi:hypothetical protein